MRLALTTLACVLSVLALTHTSAFAEDSESEAPKSITFDGQTLNLTWHGGDEETPIYEYVPEGESLDTWTHLASIREYPSIDDWKKLASGTLEQVKQNYPGCPTQMVENPTTGDTIIDFLIGPDDASFVEYNCFKYSEGDDGGTVAQQYALRAYGKEDTAKFLKTLPEVRSRILDEMAATGLDTE